MFDLANFTLSDLTHNLTALRKLGIGAESMEETANRMVRYLYDSLSGKGTDTHSCALVRLFITQPYGMLDVELQAMHERCSERYLNHPLTSVSCCWEPLEISRSGTQENSRWGTKSFLSPANRLSRASR